MSIKHFMAVAAVAGVLLAATSSALACAKHVSHEPPQRELIGHHIKGDPEAGHPAQSERRDS
jgi:hypothetical protein